MTELHLYVPHPRIVYLQRLNETDTVVLGIGGATIAAPIADLEQFLTDALHGLELLRHQDNGNTPMPRISRADIDSSRATDPFG